MGKLIDLTGQTFGEWTVIKRDYETTDNAKHAFWECKCSCGTVKSIPGVRLRKGESKSCGCLKEEQNNLTGKKYGKLLVLKKAESKNGHSQWHCLCDCGNETIVSSDKLKSGHTKSCGCEKNKNKIDLIGQKFGKLTVIADSGKRHNGGMIWTCQCECGNIKDVRADALKAGTIMSCGCLRSKGEEIISKILNQNNINFIPQKTFEDCVFKDTNKKALFDFYLQDYNTIIEYDGIQHFKVNQGWNTEEKFLKTKAHDNYKTNWCEIHRYNLIRIPYTVKLEELTLEDLLPDTSKYIVKRSLIDGE